MNFIGMENASTSFSKIKLEALSAGKNLFILIDVNFVIVNEKWKNIKIIYFCL